MSQNNLDEELSFKVGEDQSGQRLDKALSSFCPDISRARLQSLIKGGQVSVNGIAETKASEKIDQGDRLRVVISPAQEASPQAQNITLDIVYEDDHMLVINKPVGLVVHPGAGNYDGTLVNALLHHCGDSLSGIGGVIRPGIVHRLDKDTSGLMVVAKNDKAHQGLSDQLADRSLSRVYLALVLGVPMPPSGTVDKPIGRDPRNRQKMAILAKNSREAQTHYKVKTNYHDAVSLLECRLQTGRTHQIRVHMGHIKLPLVGDPMYGPQPTALRAALKKADYDANDIETIIAFDRQALHAAEISYIHPVTEERMNFEMPPPDDFIKLLKLLNK